MRRLWIVLTLAALVTGAAGFQQIQEGARNTGVSCSVVSRAWRAGNASSAIEAFSGAAALRPSAMAPSLSPRGGIPRRGPARRGLEGLARGDLGLSPEATAPYEALGEIYEAESDWPRAAESYGQAASRPERSGSAAPLSPGAAAPLSLALAHYRAGLPAAAIDPLQRAVGRDDGLAEAHYLLGWPIATRSG